MREKYSFLSIFYTQFIRYVNSRVYRANNRDKMRIRSWTINYLSLPYTWNTRNWWSRRIVCASRILIFIRDFSRSNINVEISPAVSRTALGPLRYFPPSLSLSFNFSLNRLRNPPDNRATVIRFYFIYQQRYINRVILLAILHFDQTSFFSLSFLTSSNTKSNWWTTARRISKLVREF